MKAKTWLIALMLVTVLGVGGVAVSTFAHGTAVHAEPGGD